MSKVTLLLCALLIAALVSQGKSQDYSFNYSEMVDRKKHPGLVSAVEAYDTDKDGIISGEGKWER